MIFCHRIYFNMKVYPSIAAYQEAVMNQANYATLEGFQVMLQGEDPYTVVGQQSVVFKVQSDGQPYALKCFPGHRAEDGSHHRETARRLKSSALPYMVSYKYFTDELRVGQEDYPVACMDWIAGETIGIALQTCCQQPEQLVLLRERFRELAISLLEEGIVHGDLQQDHILVTADTALFLVDYDRLSWPGPSQRATPDTLPILSLYLSLLALERVPEQLGQQPIAAYILISEEDLQRWETAPIQEHLRALELGVWCDRIGETIKGRRISSEELVAWLQETVSIAPLATGDTAISAEQMAHIEERMGLLEKRFADRMQHLERDTQQHCEALSDRIEYLEEESECLRERIEEVVDNRLRSFTASAQTVMQPAVQVSGVPDEQLEAYRESILESMEYLEAQMRKEVKKLEQQLLERLGRLEAALLPDMPTAEMPVQEAPVPQPFSSQPLQPSAHTFILPGQIPLEMVWVEAGSFIMGACEDTDGRDAYEDEFPQHWVTLTQSYYMAKYPLTQAQWFALMHTNPSAFKPLGEQLPVEQLPWSEAQRFIEQLNTLEPSLGRFSLPTEAQWEYAARGGQHSQGYRYAGGNELQAVAWYKDNAGGTPQPVGQKQPNELGLYDMCGNVEEWCLDSGRPYRDSDETNPYGGTNGHHRVARGGSWHAEADDCRVARRSHAYWGSSSNLRGFRLVFFPAQ